uniref:EF-hand domain-containing protein n=1 Tax=Streptomyces sp. NBC_00049 TaxID=2903617 RepID=A0AAU2JXP9_9ACTN
MKITIEGADKAFAEKLVALAAAHNAELTVTTVDTSWTVERAERYLRNLTASARRFAELVIVDGNGYIDADQLRRVLGKLNGPTVALSRAIPRGVREGWWPEGTSAPITVVYDPENPSWQKAIGYEMSSANVPIFRAALAGQVVPPAPPAWGSGAPSVFDPPPPVWADSDVPSALHDFPGQEPR